MAKSKVTPTGLPSDHGDMKEAEPRNPSKALEAPYHHDKADEAPFHHDYTNPPEHPVGQRQMPDYDRAFPEKMAQRTSKK